MADRAEALRARLFATFRTEAEEHLHTIRTELIAIAAEPASGGAPGSGDAPGRLESLLRAMHTLKGAARSIGLTDFEAAAHRCEALLSTLIHSGSAVEV